jgi:two-component system sensor histidine kinase AlgZ
VIPEDSIVRSTLAALLHPKRLGPILAVCIPLVIAQNAFSRDPLAVPLGIFMCALFVMVAPVSWRVLFPEGLELSHGAVRLVLYATIGAGAVLSAGAAVPKVLGMRDTLLTDRYSLLVCAALFAVGGWGLGRDIRMEKSLAQATARAEALAREAELAQLQALRSNLDPHFLFNTLNAIAEWCRQDPEVAERAVVQLSAILRTLLDGVRAPAWPLEREVELVRTLFALHLMRDPSLFELDVLVEPGVAGTLVPPMLLLPLAENAVKHGPAAGHRGRIHVEASRKKGAVHVVLENPGRYAGPRLGSAGVPNIRRRLDVAYEGKAALQLEERGERTRVELVLPSEGPLPGVVA